MRKYILFNLLLNTIFFQFVTADDIIINEIMYNSLGTDVEFVELYNSSILVVNLQGCYLLDDNEAHIPCYLEGNLEPGKFLIVAGDVSLFTSNYPGVGPINSQDFGTGTDGWSLGNGGDVVRLYSASHQLLDIVAYEDGNEWPGSADGNGSSLELLNPNFDNALSISWDPSSVAGGTPGSENSVLTNNIMPVCKDGYRGIDLPESGISVPVMVTAYDFEGLSKVELMVDAGDGFSPIIMTDDGQGDDFAAGDSIYTATIPGYSGGTLVKYYAVATDNVNQSDSWPNNAPAEYRAYTIDYKPPDLRITEVLAVNDRVNRDAYGEYDDWVEIYNNDDRTINLEGLYLSNDISNSQGFELPDRELVPGAYVLIWADNDLSQGDLHADFKLSSEGEAVALFESIEHGNVLIDGWQYGRMSADISMGFPSLTATAPEYLLTPSPGASNTASSLFSPVCINEFLTTSNFGGIDDWIEIFNRGQGDYDLSGCFLADGRRNNTQWIFPAGTVLKPNDYLVIYEDALGFSLTSGGGDVIMLTTNYTGGNVGLLRLNKEGELSPLLDVQTHNVNDISRNQQTAHAHSAWFEPSDNAVICVDKGTNELWFSRLDTGSQKLIPPNSQIMKMAPEAGPRHLVIHPNGHWIYVLNELNNTITLVQKTDDGVYLKDESFSTLPIGYTGNSICADIKISSDGKFVYASNRGHDSIAIFKVNPNSGFLKLVGHQSSLGNAPRNISLSPDENFLLVANRHSNNIVSFKRDKITGLLKETDQIEAPMPACIVF